MHHAASDSTLKRSCGHMFRRTRVMRKLLHTELWVEYLWFAAVCWLAHGGVYCCHGNHRAGSHREEWGLVYRLTALTHTHTHTHTHRHTHAHMHTHTLTDTHRHTRTHTLAHTHTDTHARTHARTHALTHTPHTHTHTLSHTHRLSDTHTHNTPHT